MSLTFVKNCTQLTNFTQTVLNWFQLISDNVAIPTADWLRLRDFLSGTWQGQADNHPGQR